MTEKCVVELSAGLLVLVAVAVAAGVVEVALLVESVVPLVSRKALT